MVSPEPVVSLMLALELQLLLLLLLLLPLLGLLLLLLLLLLMPLLGLLLLRLLPMQPYPLQGRVPASRPVRSHLAVRPGRLAPHGKPELLLLLPQRPGFHRSSAQSPAV